MRRGWGGLSLVTSLTDLDVAQSAARRATEARDAALDNLEMVLRANNALQARLDAIAAALDEHPKATTVGKATLRKAMES